MEFAHRFQYKITLGGTAVRAAVAMQKLGYTPGLHLVTINDYVKTRIPAGCRWVCSNDEETRYPHLVVQFDKGARVRIGKSEIEAPRANRIIYVHDPDNATMAISPDFGSFADNARVLLISGVQRDARRRAVD